MNRIPYAIALAALACSARPAEPGAAAAPAPTAAAAPAQTAPAATGTKAAAARVPARPAAAVSASRAAARAQDRVELENTQITGNRELPRVMYVVPWKRPDLGDLGGKPAKSLLDEVLEPVDRDVFQRQNRYYSALRPDVAQQESAPAAPAAGDEK